MHAGVTFDEHAAVPARSVQNLQRRSLSASTIRILVVRTSTELAALRNALRSLGHAVHITSVDIEPAFNAALARSNFDVVVYDPKTPAIARDTLAARMRATSRWWRSPRSTRSRRRSRSCSRYGSKCLRSSSRRSANSDPVRRCLPKLTEWKG